MENNVPEHRRFGRRHCALPVQLHCTGQSYPTSGETTDVSLQGCYVKLLFPLPVGTKVDVRIALPEGDAKTKGVVRTLDPTLGSGIEFTEMKPASQEGLERCLQEFPESTSGDFEIIKIDSAHSLRSRRWIRSA